MDALVVKKNNVDALIDELTAFSFPNQRLKWRYNET